MYGRNTRVLLLSTPRPDMYLRREKATHDYQVNTLVLLIRQCLTVAEPKDSHRLSEPNFVFWRLEWMKCTRNCSTQLACVLQDPSNKIKDAHQVPVMTRVMP